MICEYLARGAVCSQAYRRWSRPEFFKRLGLPPPGPAPRCTEVEEAAAYLVDHLLIPFYEGREVALTPAAVSALEAISAPLQALEGELSAYVPEDPVMVYTGPCVFGTRMRKNAVITGPRPIIERLAEYLQAPSHHFVAIDEGEPAELAEKYGVQAAVSCITAPRAPLKSYVLTCWENQWLGELLSKALGMPPATEGIAVPLRHAKLLIQHPRKNLNKR
ncbi:hypothetical protein [Pyrobaculum ferrireducens]|uniref:Uncharacterized protein n=1 Tax=Pyrobaculum ferrireducens TaxID=1104324 RepID=G7VGQ7_9CREN|nr:hypothetical protein [Pyrobaculum ferrireducens]AET33157.1 hypothetical protein P186_1747 [Pyrobaculum ferrireducens]